MIRFLAVAGILLLASSAVAKEPDKWGEVKTPTEGAAKIYGAYAAGCIQGAKALPEHGTGFEVVRPERHRYFGHPEIIKYIKSLGKQVNALGGEIMVSDIAQARGGPMLGAHGSHQVGLDVDIWYSHPEEKRNLTREEKEELKPVALANTEKNSLNSEAWNPYYAKLLKAAAESDSVDRIFVHPTIKQKLCETEQGEGWLYKLRPWWGHNEHFHVRLKCPAGDAGCKPQEQISRMDGCDESLTWWFSDEAHQEFIKRQEVKKAGVPPKLPAECTAVLEE